MKNFTIIPLLLSVAFILSCSTEKLENSEIQTISDPNFRVSENTVNRLFARESYDEPCLTTNLIAGQNFDEPAGTVSIDNDGENLTIGQLTLRI